VILVPSEITIIFTTAENTPPKPCKISASNTEKLIGVSNTEKLIGLQIISKYIELQ